MSDDFPILTLSPEELRLAIAEFGEGMAGATDTASMAKNAALFDYAVNQLFEVRPLGTPETEMLEDEARISAFALGAIDAAKRVAGSNKPGVVGAILTKHTQKPLNEKKQRQESILQNEALRTEVAELREEIDKVENPFYKTAKEIRALGYKVGDKNQNGTYLEKKIEDLGIFSGKEPRFLAGISLEPFEMHRFAKLKKTVQDSIKIWRLVGQKGGGMPKDGLVSAIAKLREFVDANPNKFSDPSYRPLAVFVENYESSEEELIERLQREMDMGIFEDAPELPIVPFEEEDEKNTWVGSAEEKTEISEDDFTQENIVNDLNKTATALGYSIIVEPQRIKDFIDLHSKLVKQYGEEAIKIHRTLRPNWHPLPWMVIEVQRPNKPSIAVLEIAVYENASFVVSTEDWYRTISTNKRSKAKRMPGVSGFNHVYNERAEILEQTSKLYNDVRVKHDR